MKIYDGILIENKDTDTSNAYIKIVDAAANPPEGYSAILGADGLNFYNGDSQRGYGLNYGGNTIDFNCPITSTGRITAPAIAVDFSMKDPFGKKPSRIYLGNSTDTKTEGGSQGQMVLYSKGKYYTMLYADQLCANRAVVLPDANGTVGVIQTKRVENPVTSFYGNVEIGYELNVVGFEFEDIDKDYCVSVVHGTNDHKTYIHIADWSGRPIANTKINGNITVRYLAKK